MTIASGWSNLMAQRIKDNPDLATKGFSGAILRTMAAHQSPMITGPLATALQQNRPKQVQQTMKEGGKVKKMAKGGSTASKRADGCATKGKTKGRFV